MLFTGISPNNAETDCFSINPIATGLKDYYFDLSLAPPSFWKLVRADGGDIRVTFSDRQTLVPRELKGFSIANQAGSLYVANHPRSVLGAILPLVSYGSASEMGMRFTSSSPGQVVEIRLFRGSDLTSHDCHLWSGSGTLLATVTMPATLNQGWQTVALPTPVNISAGSSYVVSYTSSSPFQVAHVVDSAYSNPPLTAPAGAGVFGPNGTFPTNNYLNSNYFIDVGFVTSAYYGMPFYVHYGNPFIPEPASALGGRAATWEPSLFCVAHLEDPTDSTQYGSLITSTSPPAFGPGKMLNGGIFNGTSNFLNLGSTYLPLGQSPRSFTFWLKKHGIDFVAPLMYGATYYPNGMNLVYVNNTALRFATYGTDVQMGTVTLDAWQHWIITFDGTSTLAAYLNGGPVYSSPITAPATVEFGGGTNYIGRYNGGADWFMNGMMDEVRIYDRLLSGTEAAGIFANQNSPLGFWIVGPVQPSGLIV